MTDIEAGLTRHLIESRDGAALFTYLFSTRFGYPPPPGCTGMAFPSHRGHFFNQEAMDAFDAAEAAREEER